MCEIGSGADRQAPADHQKEEVMPYAHITGWGMAVPDTVLTNDELAQRVDTNDKWIRERTGIRERRIAQDREFPSTLAVAASIKALAVANLKPTDVELIICATSSPEYIFPATACLIQDQLGASRAGAFDLLGGLHGFYLRDEHGCTGHSERLDPQCAGDRRQRRSRDSSTGRTGTRASFSVTALEPLCYRRVKSAEVCCQQ